MHTHYPGIESFWKVPITDDKYVLVFIWTDKKSMHIVNPKKRNKIGYCATISWVENNNTKAHKCGKKFAELHFVRDSISAGLVAHEIMHLTTYWIRFMWWILERDDEKIATFNEETTRRLWVEFYARYQVSDGYKKLE